MKIKTRRYTFIFKGKGNFDRRGVRYVLIRFGIKDVNRIFNTKVPNKYIERINDRYKL